MGAPQGFASRTERQADRVVVRWAGELDVASAERASAVLDELIALEGALVALDLAHVTFMDCRGLRCVMALREHVHREGGTFVLGPTSCGVDRVIELAGVEVMFASCD